MNHAFIPNNLSESIDWYLLIPFYNLGASLAKKPLLLNQKEIGEILEIDNKNDCYLVCYNKNGLNGEFIVKNLPTSIEKSSIQTISKSDFKKRLNKNFQASFSKHFFQFYMFSPIVTYIIFLILFLFLSSLLKIPNSMIEQNILPLCDFKCTEKILKFKILLSGISILILSSFIIPMIYYFKISKKHNNAKYFISIRRQSIILFILAVAVVLNAYKSFGPTLTDKINQMLKLEEKIKTGN